VSRTSLATALALLDADAIPSFRALLGELVESPLEPSTLDRDALRAEIVRLDAAVERLRSLAAPMHPDPTAIGGAMTALLEHLDWIVRHASLALFAELWLGVRRLED
jgi:hypothetical protein